MITPSNFYEDLDLKYPEIAIAVDVIDRLNPQPTRFIIPVLTPNLPRDGIIDKKIFQNKGNLQNVDKSVIEVNTLSYCNYITIPMTREVCGILFPDAIDGEGNPFIPDNVRYIPKMSKWLVVFVGGDITKPRIISRYE